MRRCGVRSIYTNYHIFRDDRIETQVGSLQIGDGASPDNPPRWPPITYAQWQTYWYDANYDPQLQRDVA
jgi:hypothetical protein